MDGAKSLGSYKELAAWTGRPRPWGSDGTSEVSFASDVIDALAAGIVARKPFQRLSTTTVTAKSAARAASGKLR